jgi:hypothetical protein
MPIRIEKRFAVICPVCGKYPDLGNDFTPLYKTREDAKEVLDIKCYDKLEEKIAESCGEACDTKYRHRNCTKRPCEYCKGKAKEKARAHG